MAICLLRFVNDLIRDLRNDANKAMRLALEMHALGLVGGNKANENVPDLSQLEPPKKCQNTKETIKVPTSEHVAEIVGKQGKQALIIVFYRRINR